MLPTAPLFDRETMRQRLAAVRALTQALAARLSAEDQCVQSMPDASPVKWHLAHTSWFFEAMLLRPLQPGYRAFDERFFLLFNSYYESLGPRHPRPQRGLLTRPSAAEVQRYRAHVDVATAEFIAACDDDTWRRAAPLLELGLNHEQQHQELLLTDIKHALSLNPLLPAMFGAEPAAAPGAPSGWVDFEGGEADIGHDGAGFAFDNETPRHRVRLLPYALARRPVTCGEFAAFIADGCYRRPELWLSEGWAQVQAQGWSAPLYWLDGGQALFTLYGPRELRAEFLHFARLPVVRTVRGCYQQTQDQGRDRRDQPHHEFDHVLRFGVLVMLRDVDGETRKRAAEDKCEYQDGDENGTHGATLFVAGAGSMVTFAPASSSSRLNSGDEMMIVLAAVRRRSTASGGSTKDVGKLFRYSSSAVSLSAGKDTSMT